MREVPSCSFCRLVLLTFSLHTLVEDFSFIYKQWRKATTTTISDFCVFFSHIIVSPPQI